MPNFRKSPILAALPLFPLLALLGGCSLFFGTVKVDERSDRYTLMDLVKKDPSVWSRLAREQGESGADPTGSSDWTYQSKTTGSIISANSSCRGQTPEPDPKIQDSLRAQSKLLMLGISSLQPKTERELTVAGEPALESTVEGKMGSQRIRMRSVVLRKGRCQYDLIYIAEPQRFTEHEALFAEFTDSLRIRD